MSCKLFLPHSSQSRTTPSLFRHPTTRASRSRGSPRRCPRGLRKVAGCGKRDQRRSHTARVRAHELRDRGRRTHCQNHQHRPPLPSGHTCAALCAGGAVRHNTEATCPPGRVTDHDFPKMGDSSLYVTLDFCGEACVSRSTSRSIFVWVNVHSRGSSSSLSCIALSCSSIFCVPRSRPVLHCARARRH